MLKRLNAFVLICAFAFLTSGYGQAPSSEKPVSIQWGVKIPVRDGIRLNGTLYKPGDMTDPLPVIFTFTPYIADTYHERGMYFARNGYVFLGIDVRGRGNSEGAFEPFVNEGRDGHDVVEWLARQPWSNGKVTMWGGSYAGFDQWTVLKEFPPHLATIVPAAAAHPGVDFPFTFNIFTSYIIQWLTYTSGVTPNLKLFGEASYWQDRFSELYLRHLPFHELDKLVGNPAPVFQKWISHPVPDAYYDAMAPRDEDYKRIDFPILTITGHYDGDQPGAMEYYKRHMTHGTEPAKANHFLILGPWDHAGTRTPNQDVGGLRFGEASLVDLNKLHKEWYDWTMKDGQKPEFLKKRVAYYVVGPGAECWKYADSLEAISGPPSVYYLHSGGSANDVFSSGILGPEKPLKEKPDMYTYDPLDTRPAEVERAAGENNLTDEREALNLFGNGVVYHTEPFAEAAEISGYVRFISWMSLDVPDTDFLVILYEIRPDGTSLLLTQDLMRARYRDSLREGKLVKPGEITRYEFKSFMWFSRRVSKGSRLRLLLKSPNSFALEKNYNSGGVVADESGKDSRTAHVTVYHDGGHPSFLELPVVK
ncbi:MAG: CocE/NonD family hydrolase [Candidatus Aminicenantes bacterium]|nr:CocE/NonD family hydrolase [Candidatus Aminicenantes bacterium]